MKKGVIRPSLLVGLKRVPIAAFLIKAEILEFQFFNKKLSKMVKTKENDE